MTAAESIGIDRTALLERAPQLATEFVAAEPYNHVVFDGLLPHDLLCEIANEFPENGWYEFNDEASVKLSIDDESRMGATTLAAIRALNGPAMLDFLAAVTGIGGLIPDPHLLGGGLHQIRRGGYLRVHTDFNTHRRLNLARRLNLLVYLNDDWDESYGGHLELWDSELTRCVRRVLPTLGTCVLFATTDHTPHGHPHPLTCPEGRTRRSIALYYYTNERPGGEAKRSYDTPFYDERGVRLGQPRRRSVWVRAGGALCPPVVLHIIRKVWSLHRAGQ